MENLADPRPLPGPWARLAGALWNPGPTFAAIAQRPAIWQPYLVLSLVGAGLALVTVLGTWDLVRVQAAAQMAQQQPQMKPEQVEQAMVFAWYFGLAGAAVGGLAKPWVAGAIAAGVLSLCAALTAGTGGFSRYFSVWGYAAIPSLLGDALKVPLAAQASSVAQLQRVSLSAAALFPDLPSGSAAYAALATLDLFALWSLALVVTGYAAVLGTTPGKAWWVALPFLLTYFGLNLAGGAAQGWAIRMGG